MHEQITNLGWAWHGYCHCTMRGKIYYKNGYKLYHYYENKRFWFGIKNRKIQEGTEDKLIETISTI